jgi:hypothetical protein
MIHKNARGVLTIPFFSVGAAPWSDQALIKLIFG